MAKAVRLPQKATKHIPKKRDPVGWIKNGKIKTLDAETNKVAWKGVRRGLLTDTQGGEPTSHRENYQEAKVTTTHSPRSGRARKRTPETKG